MARPTAEKTLTIEETINWTIQSMFEYVRSHQNMEFLLRFSYFEVVEEQIYDLLARGTRKDARVSNPERT